MFPQRCAVLLAACLWSAIGLSLAAQAAISFTPPVHTAVRGVGEVRAADLDGDGRIDLVAIGPRTASVLYGAGDGTFPARGEYDLGEGLQLANHIQIAIADFNGDGARDFAVPVFALNKFLVFMNRGRRDFAPPINYSAGGQPEAMVAGDFNRDGRPDLAVSHNHSNNLGILLNRGDGTFLAPTYYPAMSFAGGLTSADFNGDGNLDLAMGCFYSNPGLLYLGDGTGSFEPRRFALGGDTPARVVADDFDGDAMPDLASANYHGGNVSVLFGDGRGTLGSPVNYAAPGYPFVIASADLEGDGDPDLVLIHSTLDYFTVLQNGEAGNFLPAVKVPSGGTFLQGMTVADFNGDGRPDVAVAHVESNAVSVHLNDSPRPATAILAFDLDPADLIGACQSVTGTITLTRPAPAGGAVVSLTSTHPAVTVPPNITIPEGSVSGTFTPALSAVSTAQTGTLTARVLGSGKRVVLTVRPGGTAGLQVTPNDLIGGSPATGRVSFACPAGAEGQVVTLESSDPRVVELPAAISVGAGATEATFPLLTRAVATATPVVLMASFGGLSRTATVLVRPVPPLLAPTGLTAQAVVAGQIHLTWTDSSAAETGFAIYRREGTGDWQRLALLWPNSTRFADLEVRPGVTYAYRVQAVSDTGVSEWSNEAIVTLSPLLQAPAEPTNLTATAFSPTEIGLVWRDNSSDEAAFLIYRQEPGGISVPVATVPANITSYLDRGLRPGTAYRYQVRAWNPLGGASRGSNEVTVPTRPASP